eukprot:7247137-Prymnesium_polylepis.4
MRYTALIQHQTATAYIQSATILVCVGVEDQASVRDLQCTGREVDCTACPGNLAVDAAQGRVDDGAIPHFHHAAEHHDCTTQTDARS